ncbi:MAG: TRAP transporter small permease [Pseudomonadota bacterium]
MRAHLCRICDWLCDAAGLLSAGYIALLAILSIAEIFCRNVLSLSLPFATEYAGYLVILSLLTGLGWAMKEGAHIQVLLVRGRLPERLGKQVDMATSILALLVSTFFAIALWRFGLVTLARGTLSYFPSQTPLAIPQLLMAIGPTTLALACAARIMRLHAGETAP